MSEKTIPIPFKPILMRCDTFITNRTENYDSASIYDSTSIIVVPARITRYNNSWVVVWRCSKGNACLNSECAYSQLNRQKYGDHRP